MLLNQIKSKVEAHARTAVFISMFVSFVVGLLGVPWSYLLASICLLWLVFDERRGKPKGYIWFGLCFSWFFGLLLPIEYLALSIALGVAYGTVFQSQTDKEIEVQQEKVDQRNKIEQANHLLDQLAVETTQLIDRVNGYVDPGALEKPQKVLRDVEKYFTA